jgi:hypothetical protein
VSFILSYLGVVLHDTPQQDKRGPESLSSDSELIEAKTKMSEK